MARAKKHKDVQYSVDVNGEERVYDTFDEAAVAAVNAVLHTGEANLDVLVWSRAGAKWYGGEDGVEAYDEDPEASVFERLELSGNFVGRVP